MSEMRGADHKDVVAVFHGFEHAPEHYVCNFKLAEQALQTVEKQHTRRRR